MVTMMVYLFIRRLVFYSSLVSLVPPPPLAGMCVRVLLLASKVTASPLAPWTCSRSAFVCCCVLAFGTSETLREDSCPDHGSRERACVVSQSATLEALSAVVFFAARVLAGKMARTLRCLGVASRAPPDSFFVLPKSVLQKSFSIFLNVVSCRGRALPSGTCSSPWSCSLDSGIAYVGRGGAVSGKSRERNAM